MILLGYEILTRRSELVVFREDGTLLVHIRRGKIDPFGMGRTAFTSLRTAKLLSDWLRWRGEGIDFLFYPIYQQKVIDRSLSDTTSSG